MTAQYYNYFINTFQTLCLLVTFYFLVRMFLERKKSNKQHKELNTVHNELMDLLNSRLQKEKERLKKSTEVRDKLDNLLNDKMKEMNPIPVEIVRMDLDTEQTYTDRLVIPKFLLESERFKGRIESIISSEHNCLVKKFTRMDTNEILFELKS